MKNDRQTAVLQIIEETAVETQEQLMQLKECLRKQLPHLM